MKKIYIYLTFVCLSTILAGCDKFLDIKPTGSVIPTTLDEYRALWVSTCNNLPSDRGLAAMGADEMYVTNSGDRDKYSPIERWETNTSFRPAHR